MNHAECPAASGFFNSLLDRAFAKLDEIYPHVTVWWTTGAQQAQQLIDGEAVMTTGWNSRLYAAIRKGAPIKMEFGGGVLKAAAYAIPRGAPNAEWGQKFFATMAKPENQGKYALAFGLSGPDPDHVKYVPEDVRLLLPLHPDNLKKQVWMDQEWWLKNGQAVTERWTEWMLSHN